jgi:hypothetical protein
MKKTAIDGNPLSFIDFLRFSRFSIRVRGLLSAFEVFYPRSRSSIRVRVLLSAFEVFYPRSSSSILVRVLLSASIAVFYPHINWRHHRMPDSIWK